MPRPHAAHMREHLRMRRNTPLPEAFRRGPFRVRTALEAGLGEGRLAGADLAQPFRGVRTATDLDALGRCRAYALLMGPDHYFSHTTAAMIWGCPVPALSDTGPLHVAVQPPARARRGAGVIGHSARATIVHRRGLAVSDPGCTWLALATVLPLDELVACGDYLVHDPVVLDPRDPRPFVTLERLGELVRNYSGRGARAAASAYRLLSTAAESRPETLLRLLLWRAQLPAPEVNVDVTDAAGRVLGRADLLFRQWRTIVEYDGDEHRTNSRQYDRDITRIEAFVHSDHTVVRVRKHALFARPESVIERVERALRSRGWVRQRANGR